MFPLADIFYKSHLHDGQHHAQGIFDEALKVHFLHKRDLTFNCFININSNRMRDI